MLKKILKFTGLVVLAILIIIFLWGFISHEKEPLGKEGPEAEQVAQNMLKSINEPAWDSTKLVAWTFKGMHTYLWDKERNFVKVSWGEKEVLVNMDSIKGKSYENSTEITGGENQKLVDKAWAYFCNDSFWLNAAAKLYDPGTERSLVTLEDGRKGLKISYSSGGVTPGDAYVWLYDENFQPTSWKMWVSIIPIGGLEFTWEDWKTLSTGAKVATLHQNDLLDIEITDLKAGQDFQHFELNQDPFIPLLEMIKK
ncbi:hypothetical protein [Flexithrix dorotheae]|uniref:hypothetical protein n=1 Tax=Flexithrix dorotheae TaxID=70993 RepID=UPI000371BB9B|nr:hypothetical protein [Flexithrix dorotheae]